MSIFGPKGPFCQSCGMPLSKDEKGGGTTMDGTTSTEYCSRCYQNGAFVEPTITLEQMRTKVKDKMKAMRIPSFLTYWFTKDMDQLKRWRTQNY
jgi:hypothetical protein